MNADAGATDDAITPITQPPQNSYPRSSAFIRGKILLPSPPTTQARPRPEHPATQNPRRNPYAQSAKRSPHRCPSSPASPAPQGGPTRLPARARPAPSHLDRRTHAARHNPCAQRNRPRRPRPAGQPAPPRQPTSARRNPYAQRNCALPPPHLRALRALRGGSSFLPSHPARPPRTQPPRPAAQPAPPANPHPPAATRTPRESALARRRISARSAPSAVDLPTHHPAPPHPATPANVPPAPVIHLFLANRSFLSHFPQTLRLDHVAGH